MEFNKILLPHHVAQALSTVIDEKGKEWLRNIPAINRAAKSNENYAILVDYMNNSDNGYNNLLDATVIGFEADLTAGEKLLLYYKSVKGKDEGKGVLKTLEIINATVDGINS